MKAITVFTPTFNRAFCLGQVYDSLVSQTVSNFSWLIIDDGSTDNTKTLVDSWIIENKIEIRYIHQKNQGMHGAHNTAYANINTELNVCIDSDDFMPKDAIEKILNKWNRNKDSRFAGIIGLDAYKDSGKIVGTAIPNNITTATLSDLYHKHNVKGDKKLVLRTDVVQQFPAYPVYENERLVPLGTLYLMIDQQYTFLCANDIYCIVEYLAEGSSNNILKQYRKSPKGFGYARQVKMQLSGSLSEKFKSAVHLVSSAIFAKSPKLILEAPNFLLTLLAIPFGILLNIYIQFKTSKK